MMQPSAVATRETDSHLAARRVEWPGGGHSNLPAEIRFCGHACMASTARDSNQPEQGKIILKITQRTHAALETWEIAVPASVKAFVRIRVTKL